MGYRVNRSIAAAVVASGLPCSPQIGAQSLGGTGGFACRFDVRDFCHGLPAYGVRTFQIEGGLRWTNSDRHDIAAKAAESSLDEDRFRSMLRSLLEDRFKLIVRRETKEMPIYTLTSAKNGLRLPEAIENVFREPFAVKEVVRSDMDLTRRFVKTSYPYVSASAVLFLTSFANVNQTRAQSPGVRPEFEVASIKPNTSASSTMKFPFPSGGRFTATNINLKTLISFAYKVQGFEVSGGPGWAYSSWVDFDRYDVNARAADSNIGIDQLRPMLQSLLGDRFQLAVHRETKEVPVYAVLPPKNGRRLP